MSRRGSSGRWLSEHESDPYVHQARKEGYRSRSHYKLAQIQARDRILAPGMEVMDLGAAPGGWSGYARECVGERGRVVAVDILPMEPLTGVEFIQGDFREEAMLRALEKVVGDTKFDLVLSDMAPNISGVTVVDQAKSMYLAELALDFAIVALNNGGNFLVKVFQGEGFDHYRHAMRKSFSSVVTRKPEASRPRSRELYLLARSYRV